MASVVLRHLGEQQIADYRRDGYLAVPGLIDRRRVEELRAVTEEFVERSRRVAKSVDLFDLDPRHTADAPERRRLKNPADHDRQARPRPE